MVDLSKEALRYYFSNKYSELKEAYNQSDLYLFK